MSEKQQLTNTPRVNPFFRWLAGLVLWVMGWKLKGFPPDKAKMVIVGAPHTSNLDVFLMVMMAWRLGLKINYLVGNDVPFPLNKLSVWSNGIPIDRNHPNSNTVQQVVDYINEVDKCVLVIAPEGRLRKVKYWGSGFYYIALGANLPIVPGSLDYATKTIELTDEFYPSGDIEADMAGMREFYEGVTARFPEKTSPVRVRPRTEKMRQRLNDRHGAPSSVNGNAAQSDEQRDTRQR